MSIMKDNIKSKLWDKITGSEQYKKYEKEVECLSKKLSEVNIILDKRYF